MTGTNWQSKVDSADSHRDPPRETVRPQLSSNVDAGRSGLAQSSCSSASDQACPLLTHLPCTFRPHEQDLKTTKTRQLPPSFPKKIEFQNSTAAFHPDKQEVLIWRRSPRRPSRRLRPTNWCFQAWTKQWTSSLPVWMISTSWRPTLLKLRSRVSVTFNLFGVIESPSFWVIVPKGFPQVTGQRRNLLCLQGWMASCCTCLRLKPTWKVNGSCTFLRPWHAWCQLESRGQAHDKAPKP